MTVFHTSRYTRLTLFVHKHRKAEAQEPFRFFKLYAFGGLGVGAFIGLIIILSRLSLAIAGGEDAPDLGETIGNLSINALAISVFGFLFKGELAQRYVCAGFPKSRPPCVLILVPEGTITSAHTVTTYITSRLFAHTVHPHSRLTLCFTYRTET